MSENFLSIFTGLHTLPKTRSLDVEKQYHVRKSGIRQMDQTGHKPQALITC